MFKTLKRIAILAASAMAAPLCAADLALVLVNAEYDEIGDREGSGYAAWFERELEAAGFTTFALQDGTGSGMRAMARDFAAALASDTDNRVVVVLSGQMAATASETFLLGTEAALPDGISVAEEGIAVSPLLDLAGTAQGRSVVMMSAGGAEFDTGPALAAGAGAVEAPQGVALAQGNVRPLLSSLRAGLLTRGGSFADVAANAPRGVTYSGFLSRAIGLMTGSGQGGQGPSLPDPGEFAYWNAAQDIGSEPAFRAYLDRYPDGRFAADARARIEGLRDAPLRAAQSAEADLALTREARREVQRYLTILGFNTRGVDGIFGPATRSALTDWQVARRFDETGYLDARQLSALRSEGAARAAELEREAEARRAAEEQQDRDYWARTGITGDRADLAAYLDRYPDGIFADTARDRLDRIEEREQAEADAEIRDAWERARSEDTEEAYIRFLRRYPDNAFAGAARSRITELREPPRDTAAEEAARQQEAGVVNNPITRVLVERRLQQLGFEPGAPDGRFDAETRRAIRRFQRSRGLEVTGFVTQATMVRLLSS
ncbi:hypothetical protein OB2597_13773 [Pseudooceanicola batsensis HTCC2597]|uniref:Caspase family p20 domain-containing protein n=1 Tax=Pseudooceanicola batsensis (strain ATCC BAA-863 / DSM 15984 / KCTC 12145 / HTCC2597) TaxID=252305 RepID=A3TYI3_PSEBH|nr:peptidoglycan-binding protein [Pseudooceanicola batsensis]EAQ03217.1 hypothetical protein OB2597_13773 [Pseudooceanicola batsensis HTCC2597]